MEDDEVVGTLTFLVCCFVVGFPKESKKRHQNE